MRTLTAVRIANFMLQKITKLLQFQIVMNYVKIVTHN
jgi:hypothetical protein